MDPSGRYHHRLTRRRILQAAALGAASVALPRAPGGVKGKPPKGRSIRVGEVVRAAEMVTITRSGVADPWSEKPAFMSYPTSVALTYEGLSSGTIEIANKSFTDIQWPNSAIRFAFNSGANLWIHDCDFDSNEWDGIDIVNCSNGNVLIEWCRFGTQLRVAEQGSGRRPDAVQFAGSAMTGAIRYCKVKTGGENEDIFSFVDNSGGPDSSNLFEVHHCNIQGNNGSAGYPSTSGSGTMTADNTDATHGHLWIHDNTFLDPAQVGAAIAMGVDCHITDNIVYGHQQANSNVGLYSPYTGGAPNPGNHEIARNRVYWKNAAGSLNSYFQGGASGVVAGEASNTWDDTTIDPAALVVTL